MLNLIQKISLFHLALCFVISGGAFGTLINVDASSNVLPGNQVHSIMKGFVKTAKLAVNTVSKPIVDAKEVPPMQQAAAAFEAGETARLAKDTTAALAQYEKALAISQDEGYSQFESAIWQRIAETYAQAQDYQRAEAYYQKAVKLAKTTGHHEILGDIQANLAQLYASQGQLKRALPLYRQSLASLQRQGNRQAATQVLQATKKLEVALRAKEAAQPTEKPATPPTTKIAQQTNQQPKPKTKFTVKSTAKATVVTHTAQTSQLPGKPAIATAPESIIGPESSQKMAFTAPADVVLSSDRDPEPPAGSDSNELVTPVLNDAM